MPQPIVTATVVSATIQRVSGFCRLIRSTCSSKKAAETQIPITSSMPANPSSSQVA